MVTSPVRVIAGILAFFILVFPPGRAQETGSEIPAPPETSSQAPAPQVPTGAPAAEAATAGTPESAPTPETSSSLTPAPNPPPQTAPLLRAEQLDQLLAPIALYPDALLAQILMGSTYPLEIVKARRWLQDPGHTGLQGEPLAAAIEAEPWDPSIKALTAFPQILRMMDANLDWTEQLGDAFVAQQADVMDAVQRLRHEAAAAGTLWSNAQQQVTTEGQGIVIEPANPAFIYPPVYNPAAVYGPWPYADYPPLDIVPPDYDLGFAVPYGIGFGAGFVVARPLWRWCAFDWAQRRIRLDVDRAGRGPGSAVWQRDSAHRRGVPFADPASRAGFGVFHDHTVRTVAFPQINSPGARVAAPTVLPNPAPRPFMPAWRGPVARIQPGPGIAGRRIVTPQMMPRQPVASMMPRQPVASMMPRGLAPSRAAPPGGRPGFEGASHR
jgi:hypothetical protein